MPQIKCRVLFRYRGRRAQDFDRSSHRPIDDQHTQRGHDYREKEGPRLLGLLQDDLSYFGFFHPLMGLTVSSYTGENRWEETSSVATWEVERDQIQHVCLRSSARRACEKVVDHGARGILTVKYFEGIIKPIITRDENAVHEDASAINQHEETPPPTPPAVAPAPLASAQAELINDAAPKTRSTQVIEALASFSPTEASTRPLPRHSNDTSASLTSAAPAGPVSGFLGGATESSKDLADLTPVSSDQAEASTQAAMITRNADCVTLATDSTSSSRSEDQSEPLNEASAITSSPSPDQHIEQIPSFAVPPAAAVVPTPAACTAGVKRSFERMETGGSETVTAGPPNAANEQGEATPGPKRQRQDASKDMRAWTTEDCRQDVELHLELERIEAELEEERIARMKERTSMGAQIRNLQKALKIEQRRVADFEAEKRLMRDDCENMRQRLDNQAGNLSQLHDMNARQGEEIRKAQENGNDLDRGIRTVLGRLTNLRPRDPMQLTTWRK